MYVPEVTSKFRFSIVGGKKFYKKDVNIFLRLPPDLIYLLRFSSEYEHQK